MSATRTLGRPVRRASATVDRAMTHAETRRVLGHDPIIVFSMGKTGTTSLTRAIKAASGRPVLKAHALSDAGIAARMAKADRLGVMPRPRFLWAGEEIGRALQAGGTWDLLCGVRDPVALAVSDHFYGLQRQREVGREPWVDDGDLAGHTAAIAENLEANFIEIDWFERELRATTGIDVYLEPFATSAGYQSYTHNGHRALVLRAEDLPRVGGSAVGTFLGLDEPLPIPRRNEGTSGEPTSAYGQFLERGALPVELIERAYDTPMARHFYPDDERRAFLARWTAT